MSVAIIALSLGIVAFAQTSAGTNAARSIGLAAPAEPFTELYFTNPKRVANLTDTAQTRPVTAHVGFAVHNRGSARTYHWTASVGSEIVSRGNATILAGRIRYEAVRFPLCPASRQAVRADTSAAARAKPTLRTVHASVVLREPARSIDFLVTCHD
jgi:hypothetical protein